MTRMPQDLRTRVAEALTGRPVVPSRRGDRVQPAQPFGKAAGNPETLMRPDKKTGIPGFREPVHGIRAGRDLRLLDDRPRHRVDAPPDFRCRQREQGARGLDRGDRAAHRGGRRGHFGRAGSRRAQPGGTPSGSWGWCPRPRRSFSRVPDDTVMRLAAMHNRKLFGDGPATVSLRVDRFRGSRSPTDAALTPHVEGLHLKLPNRPSREPGPGDVRRASRCGWSGFT